VVKRSSFFIGGEESAGEESSGEDQEEQSFRNIT
jgi:hypothetical protein